MKSAGQEDSFDHVAAGGDGRPQKLLTFSSGGWVLLLAGFFMVVAAGLVLYPAWKYGLHPPVGDGVHVETYGFDLSGLTIPRERLIASKYAKDEMRAIPESLVETITPAGVKLMRENERIRFLVPGDRVIGVEINGVARAYPVRVMILHEMVNDVVGGRPIAVTWSGLCSSAVVFDRRVDGEGKGAVEFGNAGLMVASNPVFFDRRAGGKGESLWPQLGLKAVSGPLAGRGMELVPYELVTWSEWAEKHPSTTALLGLRTLKKEYGSDPYSTYLNNDDVKFDPTPLWSDPKVRKKAEIVVTSEDGKRWKAHLPGAGVEGKARIYSMVFAWYAQHFEDTDYSEITGK